MRSGAWIGVGMIFKIIRNDLTKNKIITLAATVFIAAAALLVSLSALLAIDLAGAVDALMEQAQTPHFMQMHTGDFSREALEQFAAENENVESFQIMPFLNVEGGKIWLGGNTLSGTTQDNGLTIQGTNFDYLLDLDGNRIQAQEGEIYVPVCYMRDNTASLGETADIGGISFRIAGFLRDSQMNSMLSSSKRFLVNPSDYEKAAGLGKEEYLIEFRLKEGTDPSAFSNAYTAAGLPANGPAITYPLIKMINAMSDGIMIGLLLLVSILAVLIALLCIRFTLLSQIEEDYREIGVMKAIGIRISGMKQIYLIKYAILGGTGCLAGFLFSLLLREPMLGSIRQNMGDAGKGSLSLAAGFCGAAIVLAVILIFVNRVLNRFRKISPSRAIGFGFEEESGGTSGRFFHRISRLLGVNAAYGLQDVVSRKKIYATILAVLVFAVFIVVVPRNLYSTIADESFSTYMGIGDCDLRMDIQQTDAVAEKAGRIGEELEKDNSVAGYTVLHTKNFTLKNTDDEEESIKIEFGDHKAFPVTYAKGDAPVSENQIALSALLAKELGKEVGSTLTLRTGTGEKKLTVCGIYSDITNGGKTAKAVFEDTDADIMWSVVYAKLSDSSSAAETALRYRAEFPFAKITDIREYVSQTYGQTLRSVNWAADVAAAAAVLITAFITLLFVRLLIAKDRYAIAVMKSAGFTNTDIRLQYIFRLISVMLAGILLGILLANTAGEKLAGAVLSSLGAASFRFRINPLYSFLLCPLWMVCSVLGAALTGVQAVKRINTGEHLKEV